MIIHTQSVMTKPNEIFKNLIRITIQKTVNNLHAYCLVEFN